MPVYEFVCSSCKHKFEMVRSFSQSGEPAPCPKCGAQVMKKMSLPARVDLLLGWDVPMMGGDPRDDHTHYEND